MIELRRNLNKRIQQIVLKAIFLLILFISFLFFKFDNYFLFRDFLAVSNIGIMATLFIISEQTPTDNLLNLLGRGYGILCINKLISILLNMNTPVVYGDELQNVINEIIPILYFVFEYLIITISIKLYRNNSFNKAKNIFIMMFISSIIILLFTNNKKYISLILHYLIYKRLMIFIVITLFIATIIYIIKNKKFIEPDLKIRVEIYLLGTLIYQLMFIISMNKPVNINLMYLSHIISNLSKFIIYEFIIVKVLNNFFVDMQHRLEEKEMIYRNRNQILKNRNVMLIEANNAIKNDENNYEKLIKSIEDSVFIFRNNKLYYINNKALLLINIDNESKILGKDINYIYNKINLGDNIENFNKYVDTNYYNIAIKNNDGNFKNVGIYSLPFNRDSHLLILRDITEEKRIRSLNNYIQNYIKVENMKNYFFTNISHELRTPINVIFSALQLNDIYIENNNRLGLENNNKMIDQNCLRLIRTINNFIDANKISEGYMESIINVYNIVELVEDIANAAFKYMKKKGLELIFDPEEEDIFIELDKVFLERVILNVLSNSVKYGSEGGKIKISIYKDNNNVIIEVENDGGKISEEEQRYMFDKFSKNNKKLSRTQEGSGLGLYISRALMELQDGELKVEIGEERGNKFIITYYNVTLFEDGLSNYESVIINEIDERVNIEFSDIYL